MFKWLHDLIWGKRKPALLFPKRHADTFHAALKEAHKIIKIVGIHNVKQKSLIGSVHRGEREYGGYWAWYDPAWNMDVCGLCGKTGKAVMVAESPEGTINFDILVHEMVHALLLSNGYTDQHYMEYDKYVFNWKGARSVVGKGRHYDVA